jgi:BarA-like signal transduction histidine kinase
MVAIANEVACAAVIDTPSFTPLGVHYRIHISHEIRAFFTQHLKSVIVDHAFHD